MYGAHSLSAEALVKTPMATAPTSKAPSYMFTRVNSAMPKRAGATAVGG